MPVPYCHICEANPRDSRSHADGALDTGDYCPICFRPTCRLHMGVVRWRWKKTGRLDSARVCLDCKNTYRHRDWDPVNRDWIS